MTREDAWCVKIHEGSMGIAFIPILMANASWLKLRAWSTREELRIRSHKSFFCFAGRYAQLNDGSLQSSHVHEIKVALLFMMYLPEHPFQT